MWGSNLPINVKVHFYGFGQVEAKPPWPPLPWGVKWLPSWSSSWASLSTNTFSGVGAAILAIEGLLLRLSLEHQPNSLILKRLQLLLHQKKLILQPQLIMLQIYTRNTYAYWTPFSERAIFFKGLLKRNKRSVQQSSTWLKICRSNFLPLPLQYYLFRYCIRRLLETVYGHSLSSF